MQEQEELLSQTFVENVRQHFEYTQELETMLVQTLQVLSKLGSQAPFNVDNILLKGRESRSDLEKNTNRLTLYIQELEELVRTSALITTSLEIKQVIADVIDTVITLTGAERAYLMLLKGDDDLSVMAARNSKQENIVDEEITFSRGVIKAALEEGLPILSTNAQEDERFQDMQSVMRHDLRSIMVIPMLLQGSPLGVLYLDHRLTAAVFHKKSIPILTAFANQAAIAIENARLFERVQENLERTRREVRRLRIQLDQSKVSNQVGEITGSDYFQELASMAKDLRADKDKS